MQPCNLWRCALVISVLCPAVGPAAAQRSDPHTARARTGQLLTEFKTAGRDASLTVFPAGLIGRPTRQVGDVVALLLERAGMKKLEIDAPDFRPPDQADLPATAKAFSAFVQANPLRTDYALFADFLGAYEQGFSEVRIVITNRQGETVWQDRQTPNDADYMKINPQEPLQCCLLVVQRLRPVLGLDDPTRDSAPEGRLAQRWAKSTGLPDQAEQAELQDRQQEFKKAAATATLLVYPVRVGGEMNTGSATHVAKLINEAGLRTASTTENGPQLEVKGNMSEQKVLWDMARGVREFVRSHHPAADYVLYADYLMGKDASGKVAVGGVHFAVCDREGRWVIVDFQNSHWADFQALNPKSPEDCDRLVVRRLEGYCK